MAGRQSRSEKPVQLEKGDRYHHPDLREAMIQVAQRLVEEEGPQGWTVRAAARAAGVSSGAPYRHFADKEALLAAVAERGFLAMREQIEQRLARAGEQTMPRMQALGESYVGFALQKPGRYRVMFGRDVVNRHEHPDLVAATDRTFSVLMAEVERGQQQGVLRSDLATGDIAAAAWSMIHGFSDLLLSGRVLDASDEPDPTRMSMRIGRLMFEGLMAPKE